MKKILPIISMHLFTLFSIALNAQQQNLSTQEKWPQFIGGQDSMVSYIKREIQVPVEAASNDIKGTIEVNFIVRKDGSLSNIIIKEGLGYGWDEEVIRIFQKMNAERLWLPGEHNGIKLPVTMSVPVVVGE